MGVPLSLITISKSPQNSNTKFKFFLCANTSTNLMTCSCFISCKSLISLIAVVDPFLEFAQTDLLIATTSFVCARSRHRASSVGIRLRARLLVRDAHSVTARVLSTVFSRRHHHHPFRRTMFRRIALDELARAPRARHRTSPHPAFAPFIALHRVERRRTRRRLRRRARASRITPHHIPTRAFAAVAEPCARSTPRRNLLSGRGLVTPEREIATREGAARSVDESVRFKDEDVPFVGDDDDACVATTPREGDESPLSLFGDDEASALELDASTLSPATATAETETEWVRSRRDDGEDDDDARRAMEASDASLTRPLLRSSSSSGYVEAYGASAESPPLEDRRGAAAAPWRRAEDAIENSPQMVVELDAVEDAVPERVVSEAAMGSGAGEPLLAAVGGGGGAVRRAPTASRPRRSGERSVPLLPEARATYGAASPVRAPKGGDARGKVYRLKELKTPPPPITIAPPLTTTARSGDDREWIKPRRRRC